MIFRPECRRFQCSAHPQRQPETSLHETSLDRAGGGHCTFCRIVRRELPAEVLYETERSIAILDINPIHYGHALVIPKAHCPDFLSVSPQDLPELMAVAQVVARALVAGLSLEGFNVFSNNGTVAGQSVFHFHLHVTPRYRDDNIRFVLTLKSYAEGEMTTIASRIRNHLTHH